ncbi:MAG: EAL domain-containing protein, partial [Leptospiraceae bacterium]|nr:EAL domain-containing protein [Leptospiraceae bacterium]
VAPNIFIQAAERYDLMRKIDRWVIRNAVKWISANPRIIDQLEYISINLSGKSLGNERFQRYCHDMFSGFNLPYGKILFEVTETAAIADLSMTRHFMLDLRRYGIQFALDDFGSGLSSFAYLRELPVTLLKIDGTFIRQINEDNICRLMVKSMHELAQAMQIRTVAEFVESQAIFDVLREMGLEYAQGFHIHKPEALTILSNN